MLKSRRGQAAVLLSILSIGFPATLRAEDAAQPAPATQPGVTKINIHMKQATPEEVFAEITKQSGVKFSTNGNIWEQEPMQAPNDIELSDRPFWSAVLEVCGMWNIAVQPNYGGGGNANRVMLGQMGGPAGKKAAAIPPVESEGFVVQPLGFNREQTVGYSSTFGSQNYCAVQVMVYIDPSMHVQSVSPNVKVESAVDDTGQSMAPDKKSGNRMYGSSDRQSMYYQCSVPLSYPDKPGKKISDLKFTLQVRAGSKVEALEVEKPVDAKETSKTIGGNEVTFFSMTKNGSGNYEVKVGISDDGSNRNNNMWGVIQSARLLDDKGRAYGFSGGGGGGNNDGMIQYTINYNAGNGSENAKGEPVKWVLEMPTDVKTVRVPVELKDLPLP